MVSRAALFHLTGSTFQLDETVCVWSVDGLMMLEIEKAPPSSSTPSSEDVAEGVCGQEMALNVSIDSGDYEIPQPRKPVSAVPRRRPKLSLVRDDARRVLERFLLMTEAVHGRSSLLDSSDVDGEHQYAVVADQEVPHDQMPTPYQPMGSEESLDLKSEAAAAAASGFPKVAQVESDYVDCQMFLSGRSKMSGTRSLHTLGILTHSPGAKDLVEHPPKVKSKPKRITALDSSSSSSTEDYEDYGNELLYRKKKSFFRWASERIQSFRYQGGKKTTVVGTPKCPNFSSKSDVPLPPPPTGSSGSSAGLHRDGSERSKSSSTPNEPGDQNASLQGSHHGAELETLTEEKKKNSLTWKKSDVGKDKKKDTNSAAEDKGKDGKSSVFDGLLRQFRRGSAKLKGKRGAKHRSHSADTVTIRRPTRDSMRLVQRLVDAQPRELPSEYESDVAAGRRSANISRIEGYALATPPLPAKLSDLRPATGEIGRRAVRQKMNLEGLIACRPQMPTPQVDSYAAVAPRLTTADAIDGAQALLDLEQSLMHKSSKPFSDKSEHEKEELYERIAEQLAAIADRLNLESPRSLKSSGHSGPEDDKPDDSGVTPSIAEDSECASALQLDVAIPRPTGDSSIAAMEVMTAPVVVELVKNARHGNKRRFQQIVSDSVGTDTGWQAIARMFRLTQSAVQLAGMGTAVATQIKDMTLNYFEDRFADWIVDQGGWESMVEETNTELDSELD